MQTPIRMYTGFQTPEHISHTIIITATNAERFLCAGVLHTDIHAHAHVPRKPLEKPVGKSLTILFVL